MGHSLLRGALFVAKCLLSPATSPTAPPATLGVTSWPPQTGSAPGPAGLLVALWNQLAATGSGKTRPPPIQGSPLALAP